MAEDNKMTIILVVVVGVLAIVAIIVSAVAISRSGGPTVTINNGQGGRQPVQVASPGYASQNAAMATNTGSASGRIYVMAIGHDYGAHEYFDTKGYLKGFGIQLVDLVCREVQLDCRVIWDPYENCWDSQPGQRATGGKGLHSRWYEACTGWYTTIERIHVFTFSQPYLKAPDVYFYKKPGASFSPDNIKGKKIVFIEGWASDEKCLARESTVVLTADSIYYAKSSMEAIQKLDEDYAAIFTTVTTMLQYDGNTVEKVVSHRYSCMVAGTAIMTRKDSDFTSYWNNGFNKVRSNGQFEKLCKQANDEHAKKGDIQCLNSF